MLGFYLFKNKYFLRTTPTKALFPMLNWLPTGLLAKRAAKVAAIKRNALSHWQTVLSGHSTILGLDPVAPVNIDYFPAACSFGRGFHFLITGRDGWNYDTIVPPRRP